MKHTTLKTAAQIIAFSICLGCNNTKTEAAPPPVKTRIAPPRASTARLGLSWVSRFGETRVGWPVVVEVWVGLRRFSRAGTETLTVGSDALAWSSALRFDLVDANGVVQSALPFRLCAPAANSAVVSDQQAPVDVRFGLSPEDARRLPQGDFRLRVTLDTRTDPAADRWRGVTSAEQDVRILEEALSPSGTVAADGATAEGIDFRENGLEERALAAFDRAMSSDPDHLEAATERARHLLAVQRFAEAHQAFSRAIEISQLRSPHPPEPPLVLHEGLRKALDGMRRSAP